jgi:hypothetical protein
MSMFTDWCDRDSRLTENGRKQLLRLTESNGGRAAVMAPLAEKVRSHYVDNERISQDIQSMGYNRVAAVLEARLPQTARARSGDFGEIIATELAEEELGYDVPIRRLRYKDGRELALRGDDVIGFKVTPKQKLSILKGESKSRVDLSADVISKAREALSRNDGRPYNAGVE